MLLAGSALLSSSPVGAQQRASGTTSAALPNVVYTVVRPAFFTFYNEHGGARTYGTPVSNDFQLLGLRVQMFQNQVVQQHPDGSVTAMDLLSKAFPLTHADGATFPTPDQDMASNVPALTSPTYQSDALAAIDNGLLDDSVPDTWSDIPVNFNATFRSTITCDDLPAGLPCDDHALLSAALDFWGLPVSQPTQDPNDPNRVYQRFQRGIMQFSAANGSTQPVPVGDLFRRVLQDQNVPDDLRADMTGSRFLAEYSPSVPLGVSRPLDLPATSLAAAFAGPSSTDSTSSLDGSGTPTPSANGSVFGSGLPNFGQPNGAGTPGTPGTTFSSSGAPQFGTPVASFGTPGTFSATTTGTPVAGQPAFGTTTPAAVNGTPGTAPLAAATGPDPCAGDEQIMFSPNKPYANTDVLVSVTSARHHTSSTVRLTGPVKAGPVNERQGLNGWVWEWTVTPAVDGWYEFTFYTDGARKCATSGFNVLPAFGTTATPTPGTPTAFPTSVLFPTATATPAATAVAAPVINPTADPPSGACAGTLVRITGSNFGNTQLELQGSVLLNIVGGSKAADVKQWTNTGILFALPSPLPAGPTQILVTTTAGISNALTYTVGC